jgi:hypothetical protein
MPIPFEEYPLIDRLLGCLREMFSFMNTVDGDCEGDLNRYKDEYHNSIAIARSRYDQLWNDIRERSHSSLVNTGPQVPDTNEEAVCDNDNESDFDEDDEYESSNRHDATIPIPPPPTFMPDTTVRNNSITGVPTGDDDFRTQWDDAVDSEDNTQH